MYSSPGRLWLVLAGVSVVFLLGCQETRTLSPTLGNLPQQQPNSKEPEINASTYFAHAHLLERQGQFERAAKQYKRALALRPQFLSARNRLGITLNKLGRHAEASLQFQQALAGYPATAYLYNNLGFSLYLEGRHAEAEAALSQALELKPGFARAHMNRALALARLDRLDEAFTELKLVNNEPDAYFNMGVILIDAEQYDEAGRYFEAALALRPDFDAARQQLSEATRLVAEAEARQAALALIAQAHAEEQAATETAEEVPGETAMTDEPEPESTVAVVTETTDDQQEPSEETVVAEAPPADETSEAWETTDTEEVAQNEEDYYEPVDPMPVEDETTDVTADDTPEAWETTDTEPVAQNEEEDYEPVDPMPVEDETTDVATDDTPEAWDTTDTEQVAQNQEEFSEPGETDVVDSSAELEPTPAEGETTDVTADYTPDTWDTTATEEQTQDQEGFFEPVDTDVADSSTDADPMSVEDDATTAAPTNEEPEVASEQTIELPVAEASVEPGVWGDMDMVWLDYVGPENDWDQPESPQSTQGSEIDPDLLFAMINEAIADLHNRDSDSFDSLWCRIGYYLFPETMPDEPETGFEQLADQSDYVETTTDGPIGK